MMRAGAVAEEGRRAHATVVEAGQRAAGWSNTELQLDVVSIAY